MSQFLIYHGPINYPGATNLKTLVISALQDGVKELTVCICSDGGNVTAGIGIYNFLKMVPAKVNTHNFGACGSIAATIFLAGERRTTAEASTFCLHASTFIEGPQKGKVSESTAMIYEPFRRTLSWNDERISTYFSTADDSFLKPDLAKEFGIVHEVVDLKFPDEAKLVPVNVPLG